MTGTDGHSGFFAIRACPPVYIASGDRLAI